MASTQGRQDRVLGRQASGSTENRGEIRRASAQLTTDTPLPQHRCRKAGRTSRPVSQSQSAVGPARYRYEAGEAAVSVVQVAVADEMISVHGSVHELLRPAASGVDCGACRPAIRQLTGHGVASAPTTDQKVRGSNPFGRTLC